MLHLQPSAAPDAEPKPYAEAVSRLASIRHALRLVDDFGGGPSSDSVGDDRIAAVWDDAGNARLNLFDRRSSATVQATAAALDALMSEHRDGRTPHQEASRTLVEQIRSELEEVARIVLR